MKKIFCVLTALILLFSTACAETSIIEKPALIIEMITPSPSSEPAGETYSSEDMIVTLPAGLHMLDEDAFTGYEAAVSFDYPTGGTPLLMAVNEEGSAALSFTLLESAQDAASAARDAALSIPFASVEEKAFGENNFSVLSCTISGTSFRLFFLSDESRLLCVGASGLEEEALNAMLAGLSF